VGLFESVQNDAQHFGFWSRLAGPQLKLASTLMNKHLIALNGGDATGVCGLEQRCVERVVDQVEDEASFPRIVFER